MIVRLRPLLALGGLLFLAGCAQDTTQTEPPATDALVSVDGSVITERDLALMLRRTVGEDVTPAQAETLRDRALDSLIDSRAMRLAMETRLNDGQIADIEARARAYAEELYVSEYLQQFAVPEPVSSSMVEQYYRDNPEAFGGGTRYQFEWLRSPEEWSQTAQDRVLNQLEVFRTADNWQARADRWATEFQLEYRLEQSTAEVLPDPLAQALTQLTDQVDTSGVLYVQGRLYLVRLVGTEQIPPQPLWEVQADIRQRLAPTALRRAVQQAAEAAREQANIEFMD